MTSGERIRALRRRLGVSQVELAALLGVSNVTVNRWERDRVQPESATMARIARSEREGIDALRPAGESRTNLPMRAAPLLGRDVALQALETAVRRSPLVTLVGPGGVGKTRLAVAAAASLAERFPHGVWFVDLASLTDDEEVAPAVAQALGIRESGRRSLVERIAAGIAERTLLVILDNCEHLLAACAELCRACLAQLGDSRILATSREPLGLRSETVHQVAPLPPADAAELFVQRARDHQPGFTIDERERVALAGLCARLDGLPLAIELAAARAHVLSVDQIASRLDRRFALLRTPLDLPERQRALETAIAWSHDLLDADDAARFRRLGVFSGSFDLTAVDAVVDGDALDSLDRLARQSLVTVERTPAATVARYRLLESIAAFARLELQRRGDADDAHRRHAAYFSRLAHDAAGELRGPKQLDQLARLDLELPNITAALEWWIGQGDAAQAVKLAAALAPYWHRRSRFSDGQIWLRRALALPPSGSDANRAAALAGYGTLATWTGGFDEARAALDEAVAIARRSGDRAAEADALDVLGIVARGQGVLDQAVEAHDAALAIHLAIGNRRGAAISRSNLGLIANVRGDLSTSERSQLDAWSLIQGFGDVTAEAAILANLGETLARAGRVADATASFDRAIALLREIGDPDRLAIVATNAAELKAWSGESDEAYALATEAVEQFRRIGNRVQLAGARYVQGMALAGTARKASALAHFREALANYYELGDWYDTALTIEAIAGLFLAAGAADHAAHWLGGAEALRERDGVGPYPMFDYAGALNRARTLLDPDAFARAWAEGRARAPEQLVAEALHLGRLRDEEPAPRPSAPNPPRIALTERQMEVLRLVAAGRSNRETAAALQISERTVERHLTAIFTLLGADRRSAAVATAIANGLLST